MDGASRSGLVLTVTLHFGIAVGAFASSRSNESPRVEPPRTQKPEVITAGLLRLGGGGEPTRPNEIHRRAPVLAQQRAPAGTGPRNPNQPPVPPTTSTRPLQPEVQIGATDTPALGPQELAELQARIRAEQAINDPNLPPGPGLPDGSVHGSETDPARAAQGARAKIRSFIQRSLRILQTHGDNTHRAFTLEITISDDGGAIVKGHVVNGSGDDVVDADLNQQILHLAENHTPIPEMTEAERAEVSGALFHVQYTPEP